MGHRLLRAGLKIGLDLVRPFLPPPRPESPQNWNSRWRMNKGVGKGEELRIHEILQVPGTLSVTLTSNFFSVVQNLIKCAFSLERN